MNLVAEVKKEGKIEGKREVARNLLKKGMEIPEIASVTGLSEDEIVILKKELTGQ